MNKVNLISKSLRETDVESGPYVVKKTALGVSNFFVQVDSESLLDLGLNMSLFLFVSTNNQKYVKRAGMTCVGNSNSWKEKPSLSVPSKGLEGKYIKIRLTLNKLVDIGVDMEDKTSSGVVLSGIIKTR